MQFQLCTIFFTFSLGTRTHYFGRTILHGGAGVCSFSLFLFNYFFLLPRVVKLTFISQQYKATGRGFVVRHIKFAENYRLYSRSHFVKGCGSLLLSLSFCACVFYRSALSYTTNSIQEKLGKILNFNSNYIFEHAFFVSNMLALLLSNRGVDCDGDHV